MKGIRIRSVFFSAIKWLTSPLTSSDFFLSNIWMEGQLLRDYKGVMIGLHFIELTFILEPSTLCHHRKLEQWAPQPTVSQNRTIWQRH
jgi:hypothetical protein